MNTSILILKIFIVWTAWLIIGGYVLSIIDNHDEALRKWAASCPIPGGYVLVLSLWPVVVLVYLFRKK